MHALTPADPRLTELSRIASGLGHEIVDAAKVSAPVVANARHCGGLRVVS